MLKIIIGIDPGLNGAIVGINNSKIMFKTVMPTLNTPKKEYNINELVNIFNMLKSNDNIELAVIEKQGVRPISGKRACFLTGGGYYLLKGILTALEIPYEVVNPQTWMKEFSIKSKDKKGSVLFCLSKYPSVDFTVTERSKKPHDGITDAVCIALYGERRLVK